jgi:CRP-like cAMP-binding protein
MRKTLYILGRLLDEDIEWMISVGTRRSLAPGAPLIRQGEPADALSIVLDGRLAVEIGGQQITQLGVGEIVGEMSFVDADPPSATVRAARSSLVLCVPRDALARHLEADLGFAARFYRAVATVLSGRLRQWNARAGLEPVDPVGSDELDSGDEVDAAVLDNLHLAGARFDHILKRLAGR